MIVLKTYENEKMGKKNSFRIFTVFLRVHFNLLEVKLCIFYDF